MTCSLFLFYSLKTNVRIDIINHSKKCYEGKKMNLIANENVKMEIVDENAPIRIIISSLSLGGAEKIVADWASSEGSRGRDVEIAVIHTKTKEHMINSSNVKIVRRGKDTKVSNFLVALVKRWGKSHPVSTHLLDKNVHSFLWSQGLKTVPVIHNDKRGWKLSAEELNHPNVLGVVACAKYVKDQLIEEGYKGEVMTIRHLPMIDKKAFDMEQRTRLRKKFSIDDDTLLIGAIGAIKIQKNYSRLVDIAKKTNRKCEFIIFGDAVNQEGLDLKLDLLNKIEENDLFGKVNFMGFKEDVFSYFPILDAVINCSDYEGYSIATQEALLSGLPVIATKVSGQSEISLDGLTLIDQDADDSEFVSALDGLEIRTSLKENKMMNASRIWSLSLSHRQLVKKTKTLFITANLNAGGAQRSLVNLATQLVDDIAIAVCNETTNPYFSESLFDNGVDHFQLSQSRDVFDLTQVALNEVYKRGVENVVLWNVDPKMKLLFSEFLPSGVKYFDISPGGYAFEELDATLDFQKSTTIKSEDFYSRLDKLVLKYDADLSLIEKYEVETEVIRNGVDDRTQGKTFDESNKNILVSGRLVESKHIVSIIKAFKEFNKSNNQEFTLNFYGQAEFRNKNYLERVEEMSKDENVLFHGSDSNLSFMEKNFAMTIVLGTHQGCPNAVLESAYGLIPVLANDSGGTREIIKDEVSGVLIPDEFSHEELLSGMFKMMSLNRLDLVNGAKEIVENKFSMSLMKENYSILLDHTEKMESAA